MPFSLGAQTAFFVAKVQRNLHLVLAFSPVGGSLRRRAHRFPAIVGCTTIDWFHPWSKDALISVATQFLADVDITSSVTKENLPFHLVRW